MRFMYDRVPFLMINFQTVHNVSAEQLVSTLSRMIITREILIKCGKKISLKFARL